MRALSRLRLVLVVGLPLLAVGGAFLACGRASDSEAPPEPCGDGACDASVSPESPEGSRSTDAAAAPKDNWAPAPDAGLDARPLAPCGDGALPGALDPSFGDGGLLAIDPGPGRFMGFGAALILPDGRTLLGGGIGDFTYTRPMLVRLTSGGVLDPSFGDGGIVETPVPWGKSGGGDSLALTADGRILASGPASPDGGTNDWAIRRYSAGGSLDGTFGDGGFTFVTFGPNGKCWLPSLAVAPDGHILAVGWVGEYGSNPAADYLIVRLDANGSRDPTFGTSGTVRVDISTQDLARATVVQPDGKILVVGSSHPVLPTAPPMFGPEGLSAIRLHPDGSLDPTFGSAGKVVLNLPTESGARNVAVDSVGRIVIGGWIRDSKDDDHLAVFRLTSTGALDTTFGTGGVVSANLGADSVAVDDGLYIQPDGKYLLTGVIFPGVGTRDALVRFLPDGAPDPGFGTGGGVVVPNPPAFRVRSVAAAFGGDRAVLVATWNPNFVPAQMWAGASRYCL
jgi:uncharacterized delta-60 repeat protein